MKVNKPLIKKIIKAIREHHDQFQMSDWFSDTLDIEDDSQEPALAGGCGTAGCIAGWAIFLSKRYRTLAEARDENAQGDPLKLAARILGLRQTTEYGTTGLGTGVNDYHLDWEQEKFCEPRFPDKAFWAQVCDVVDGSLSQIKFNSKVQEIRDKADGKSVGNPVDVVEVLANRLELSETEQKNVLQHLTTGGSLDLWGVTNAVTRAAEDCESYDRAIELERAGAMVLAMKPSDFASN